MFPFLYKAFPFSLCSEDVAPSLALPFLDALTGCERVLATCGLYIAIAIAIGSFTYRVEKVMRNATGRNKATFNHYSTPVDSPVYLRNACTRSEDML